MSKNISHEHWQTVIDKINEDNEYLQLRSALTENKELVSMKIKSWEEITVRASFTYTMCKRLIDEYFYNIDALLLAESFDMHNYRYGMSTGSFLSLSIMQDTSIFSKHSEIINDIWEAIDTNFIDIYDDLIEKYISSNLTIKSDQSQI